ncbi:hypothetical protein PDIG_63670 [Penicillium digitatum PHI26]|uniref:Uncharacterized protein n=2 Tax=Penicillium digitatum TaxID=36651 RepID=K9FIY8_PEND2|nr:hypothetical protein PDIP_73020 [Penicillium digitatum Pd1]EKV07529.1 hypothetical protein PDIP_73020 [Penicillium digitatum Pd1]EKV09234.1 hypothetical protein PDIG_63670 [Penicillium digitatum PHI26]
MAGRKPRDSRISRLGNPSGEEPGEPQRHSNFRLSTLLFFLRLGYFCTKNPGDPQAPWRE